MALWAPAQVGTSVSKTDSTGTRTYLRDGVGVTLPLLADGAATYTPGISERRGTASTYQLDGLKNTFAQSDASGGHVSSRNYDAFGAVTSSSGTHQGPFGYGGAYGYQTDPDTGLMLLGHRYYDPSVGRFLTRDPIKDGRNWYGYGGGYANPVNSVDPDGLHPLLGAIGAGLLIVDGFLSVKELIEDPGDPLNWLSLIGPGKPIKWFKRGKAWLSAIDDVAQRAVPIKKGAVGLDATEALITKNRRKRLAAEKQVAREYEEQGYTIDDVHPYVWTPLGKRYLDLQVTKDGVTFFVEVKSGNARYDGTLQSKKDDWIRNVFGFDVVLERR